MNSGHQCNAEPIRLAPVHNPKLKRKDTMEYALLNAILHGERLTEPLTWIYIAALIAVSIAGWMVGGIAFDKYHQPEGE